jgi:DNA-binding LacI/PurR family transcriptional regulator
MSLPPSRFVARASRPQIICNELTRLAHKLGPGEKLPTVTELREMFGGSLATINMALEELETRHVIQRKHGVGIFVSPALGRRRIRVLFNSRYAHAVRMPPFWGALWTLLADEARLRSDVRNEEYDFRLFSEGPDAKKLSHELPQLFETDRIHAMLTIGFPEKLLPLETTRRLPIVGFAGDTHWTVALNQDKAVKMAVRELAQRGCRHLAFWPMGNQRATDPIFSFYRNAIAAHEIEYVPELVYIGSELPSGGIAPSSQDHGYALAKHFFTQRKHKKINFDGLVVADDMVTDGALAALREMNILPGRDIQIATLANSGSPILYRREKQLVMIDFDTHEIVHEMFALLDLIMDGKPPARRFRYVMPRLREASALHEFV